MSALPPLRLAALLWLLGAFALPASARDLSGSTGPAPATDGPAYAVSEILPIYARPHPQHPPLDALRERPIRLAREGDAFVAPRPGLETVEVTLDEIAASGDQRFHASALATVNMEILVALNEQGLGGVTVSTDPRDIDPVTGQDRRGEGRDWVRVSVDTGRIGKLRVSEVQTIGFGERVGPDDSVGNPVHARVLEKSPIQPAESAGADSTDLLRVDLLENYVAQLSRHPGRDVYAEITPSRTTPGVAYLDYKIVEEKPWSVYAQASRTGTEATHRWRQRFGFRHTQLSGADDVLRLDWVTGGEYDDIHALFGSYERPIPGLERVRVQLNAAFSEYDAREIGFGDARFEGRTHNVGLEAVANVFQRGRFFVDAVAGARWSNLRVTSKLGGPSVEGHQDFFLPKAGLRFEHTGDKLRVRGEIFGERSLGGGHSVTDRELNRLGRVDPDDRWQVLRWNTQLFAWLDRLAGADTRAHELMLRFVGQEAFGNRLIPQEEMVVGGMHTVRGYPQAALAGDSVLISSAEYRLHVPGLFTSSRPVDAPVVGDFKVAPRRPGGSADWDLVLRAFTDLGRVRQSQRRVGEIESTLFGMGVGLEIELYRNFLIRYDLGIASRALENINGSDIADTGDVEHNLLFTVLF